MSKTLLVIEDDASIALYLKDLFKPDGYLIKALNAGGRALETIEKIRPDLVVMGLEPNQTQDESLLSTIKKSYPNIAVIVLAGKDSSDDKINALEIGADDYIAKPFVVKELALRIKARLKDCSPKNTIIKVEDLAINTNKRIVKRGSQVIDLSPQEYKLLEHMMINRNKVLSRETLLNRIWPNTFDIETRVVDVYISYLRKKVDNGFKKKLIRSVRGVGYSIS